MRKLFLLALITTIIISSCKKSTDDFQTIPLSDYYPLQVGKYITYNLDSTVFINFGTKDTVIKYQVKHQVDAQITDNLGRPAYRILRYIRKTAANPWVPDNTFMAVPTGTSIEFIENNMRLIKLASPIRNGFSWKGHRYVDIYGVDMRYLEDWDYTYDSLNTKITLGAIMVDSTLKVAQRDEVLGNPSDPNSYHEINYGAERYAKGIGLVFRNFLHVEYQPPRPGVGAYRQGYGVKLTMIDHN
ncbi:MAG TPA: hypothetical protein PLZ45_10270 [Ferruginibacter sp.]|nr:hypothetical protein [Chitinophagaceae bacterium]HRI25054.1 hypothetical protein [Ferruginibacter sp.]